MESSPLKDFWNFIKYPTPRRYDEPVQNPFFYINRLFLAAFFFNLLVLTILNATILDPTELGGAFDGLDFSFWKILLVAVVAAPLVEEIIFRLPLRNKTALTVLIAVMAASYSAIILNGQNKEDLIPYVAPAIFSGILLLSLGSKFARDKWNAKLEDWYPYIFFIVAGMFALIHIYNYNEEAYTWWMVPLLVIPQFVLALFLGFVRLRVGFWACVYMHALNNLIPSLMLFASESLPEM